LERGGIENEFYT